MEYAITTPTKPVNALKFYEETKLTIFVRGDNWFIGGECSEDEALAALDAHDATVPERTITEKLASVGLSIDDLKVALGL